MSRTVGPMIFVFPGVDEEAVEAAEGGEEEGWGEECGAKAGLAGDGGDEGGGGEADAYGELFWEPMRALSCVDEDEVSEDQAAEDEVEVNGFRWDTRKEYGQGDGGEEDSDEEGGAVAIVKVVAGFEGGFAGGLGIE